MKILVIGDLEGKVPKKLTRKFIIKNKIDFIISPGDFADSRELAAAVFKYWYKSLEDVLGAKKFNKIIKKQYDSGVSVLKKLDKINVPIYAILGNHDYNENGNMNFLGKYKRLKLHSSYGKIIGKMKNIKYMNKKAVKVGKYKIVFHDDDYRFINSERYLKGGYSKKEIDKTNRIRNNYMKDLTKLMRHDKNIILVTHRPPYKTKLDKIVNAKSPRNGEHVGDVPIRHMIEKYQPVLHICGHMHEGRGKCKLGRTLVVNSGFGQKGEAVIIDLPKLKTKFINL